MDQDKLAQGVKKFFSGDGKIRLIVILGLLGMALILLSQFFDGGSGKTKEVDTATAQFTSEEYIAELEGKLTALITGIDGVGEARVMVTLESGVEYIYAQEEKRNTDTTREGGTTEVSCKVYEKENVEQKYILVDQNGKKQPLLQTELQPKIQGVVIVCEGADNVRVEQSLTNVVTTALNIPSTRVCVVKINTQRMQEEAQ